MLARGGWFSPPESLLSLAMLTAQSLFRRGSPSTKLEKTCTVGSITVAPSSVSTVTTFASLALATALLRRGRLRERELRRRRLLAAAASDSDESVSLQIWSPALVSCRLTSNVPTSLEAAATDRRLTGLDRELWRRRVLGAASPLLAADGLFFLGGDKLGRYQTRSPVSASRIRAPVARNLASGCGMHS